MKKHNKLIVFSAPSGSGKTTIVNYLLSCQDLSLGFSISATSRPPRSGEVDGKSYFFISPEEFKNKIIRNEFLEYEEVYKDYFYGTLFSEVDRLSSEDKYVIFDIDVEGGLNIRRKYPQHTLSIFVKPPSLKELERRLRNRGTETQKSIEMRLSKAQKEFLRAPEFDFVLENDSLEKAKNQAHQIVYNFINQ